jgi:hypothetical protein
MKETCNETSTSPDIPDAAHRYSPGHAAGVERTVIRGRPDPEKISTSYVERFNLSSRMQMRRFTRLTNPAAALSKISCRAHALSWPLKTL